MPKPFLKIAHVSDTHAGYRAGREVDAFGVNLRENDGYKSFEEMVTQIIENDVDCVLMAGDTFHISVPTARSILFVRAQLWRLWEASIPVYALGGNHEIKDVAADISSSAILHDPWRGLYSHVEPYVKHEIKDGVFLHLISHHMYGEQFETMKQVKPVKGAINIFSTHGSVIDPILEMKLHTEQSPREIVIPDGMLYDNDWSYTLLGHIHERGWVGSKDGMTDTYNSKIYYNGSLLRRGFSDAEVPLGRGWTLWEVDEKGVFKAKPKEVWQRPQLDFKTINATEMTASDISDRIISNLRGTQEDGNKFIVESAPILRQPLLNIDSAKYAALDWKHISENRGHAFDWKPHKISKEQVIGKNDNDNFGIIETLSSGDIVEAFERWTKTSEMLEKITEEKTKEKVSKQAKSYIKSGQEKEIERED